MDNNQNNANELLQTLFQTMNSIRKHNGRHFHFHLNSQTRVLWILSQRDDHLTQSELSELLDIRPSSTSELLKKLESKGLITRSNDPNDRRITIITLTEAGKAEAAKTSPTNFDEMATDLTAGLTEAEIIELTTLLQKMRTGLNDGQPDDDDDFGPFRHPDFRSPFGGDRGFSAHHNFFHHFF